MNKVSAIFLLPSVCYSIGAKNDNYSFKVPIYITLLLVFSLITYRGFIVLQTRSMFWVPVFVVRVNLFFVWLLQEKGRKHNSSNYIFHIAHDLLGTELGVAAFAYLVYKHPNTFETKDE